MQWTTTMVLACLIALPAAAHATTFSTSLTIDLTTAPVGRSATEADSHGSHVEEALRFERISLSYLPSELTASFTLAGVSGEFFVSLPFGPLTINEGFPSADLAAFADVDADVLMAASAALSDAVRRIAIMAERHNKPAKFVVAPGALKKLDFAPTPAGPTSSAPGADVDAVADNDADELHSFLAGSEPRDLDRLSFAPNAVVTQIVAEPSAVSLFGAALASLGMSALRRRRGR